MVVLLPKPVISLHLEIGTQLAYTRSMDVKHTEESIKVLARLTPEGECLPAGSWYYHTGLNRWFLVTPEGLRRPSNSLPTKGPYRLSELEANARGIYRDDTTNL